MACRMTNRRPIEPCFLDDTSPRITAVKTLVGTAVFSGSCVVSRLYAAAAETIRSGGL